MLETPITQEGGAFALPETAENPGNIKHIDLEGFLRNYHGNGEFDASGILNSVLKSYALSDIALIGVIAGQRKDKSKLCSSVEYLKDEVDSMSGLIGKIGYDILDGGGDHIKSSIEAIGAYVFLIKNILKKEEIGENDYHAIWRNTIHLIGTMLDFYKANPGEEQKRGFELLGAKGTILAAVQRADRTIKKVRGFFDYQTELASAEMDDATKLLFEYLIRKCVMEGDGTIKIRLERKRYFWSGSCMTTTIGPYYNADDILSNRESGVVYKLLNLKGGTIIPEEDEITIAIRPDNLNKMLH